MVSGAENRPIQSNPFILPGIPKEKAQQLAVNAFQAALPPKTDPFFGLALRQAAYNNNGTLSSINALIGLGPSSDVPDSPEASLLFPTPEQLEQRAQTGNGLNGGSPTNPQQKPQDGLIKNGNDLDKINKQLRVSNAMLKSQELNDNQFAVFAAYDKVRNIADQQYYINTQIGNAQAEMAEAYSNMSAIEQQANDLAGKIEEAQYMAANARNSQTSAGPSAGSGISILNGQSGSGSGGRPAPVAFVGGGAPGVVGGSPNSNRNGNGGQNGVFDILAAFTAQSFTGFGSFTIGDVFQPFKDARSIREAYTRIFDDRNSQYLSAQGTVGDAQSSQDYFSSIFEGTVLEMSDASKELHSLLNMAEFSSSSSNS